MQNISNDGVLNPFGFNLKMFNNLGGISPALTMKKTIILLLATGLCHAAVAQNDKLINLKGEVRVDYQRDYIDGDAQKSDCGFKGKYVNFQLDGTIAKGFTYSYRQRLNKAHADQSFFDATDWAYLNYQADEHWTLSGGKQVVAIGGYEYDRAPIDLYYCSEFWNNIPCYELGVSATYAFNGGKDRVMGQVCESPFRQQGEDMYGYSMMWMGSHGLLNTLYSANAFEYAPGKFIYYLALGHELTWGGTRLQLDLMNRASKGQTFFLKDCSVMAELRHGVSKQCDVTLKMTYDVNKTNSVADQCVLPHTEITRVGGGVEYYPIKNSREVRLHANAYYSWGKNGNANGTRQPKQTMVNLGATWKVKII